MWLDYIRRRGIVGRGSFTNCVDIVNGGVGSSKVRCIDKPISEYVHKRGGVVKKSSTISKILSTCFVRDP